MFTYNQSNGSLSRDGELIGVGYSGLGVGKNNAAMQDVHDLGPIPQGRYTIELPPFQSETHGPECMRLTPSEDTNTFDRSGFLLHGDSIHSPGQASHGCIILGRSIREAIAESGDTELEVV